MTEDMPGTAWLLASGALVWLMPAGLALLATGLTRGKNAVHTAFMPFIGSAVAVLGSWLCGFAVMDRGTTLARHLDELPGGYALFFWRTALVCVVVSIPTGALAERWRLKNLLAYSLFVSCLLFPSFAAWTWGDGWLARLGVTCRLGVGFVDFAGAGVVHVVGGLSALAGAVVLGPRLGRYSREGGLVPIPAHNVPLALLGSFLLAVGWLGFNIGPTPDAPGRVATVTILAGAAGAVAAAAYMVFTTHKPDPTITINGLLAGLVSSSASAAFIAPTAAVILGTIAGLLICLSVRLFDKARVDDPVGAISVHGVGGLWGVLAAGIFAHSGPVNGCLYGGWGQLGAQVVGALALVLWAFGLAWVFFKIINRFIPMRVAPEVEMEGLDISETGLMGYPTDGHLSAFSSGFASAARKNSRGE